MSKSKQHAPSRKEGRKTHRAKIDMNDENRETLEATRTWLRNAEAAKLRGRFTAFEDTMHKLQTSFAKHGPSYQRRQIGEESVHKYVEWVNDFNGVFVKRKFLDVGQKKGKAWADQHRAKFLGGDFFTILLDELEVFVNNYHSHTDLTKEKFLYECLVAALKKTFSPGSKQAGETPLICDQAVKTGPTRDKLAELLPSIDLNKLKVKKGRDVVDLLEDKLLEDFRIGHLADEREREEDTNMEVEHESKSVSSESSSFSSGSVDATPPWNMMEQPTEDQTMVTTTTTPSDEVSLNWSTFPMTIPPTQVMTTEALLTAENCQLKRELETIRRQLILRDLGYGPGAYNYPGTASLTASIPIVPVLNTSMEYCPVDEAMLDVSGPGYSQEQEQHQVNHYSLTPNPSRF